MALRERSATRAVKGRHRAAPASARVEVPALRTSHRWAAAGTSRPPAVVPAPRRAVEPVVVPAPRRAVDVAVPGPRGRADAARLSAAGLAGARLATAVLTRASGAPPVEPGVRETPVDPWSRRGMPVRYRPLRVRRRRLTAVWVLLALALVTAVGAIPSALRDPALSGLSEAAAENIGGGGGGAPVAPAPAEFTDQLPDGRAQAAVDAALSQLGVPYQWGGNGPGAGDTGFDCSGLTVFAYAAAGITLPRTAHAQYAAGPHLRADAALQPGDLVFYGTPSAVHHVGIYLGDGRMVNAPTYGEPVQTSFYRWRGDDYLGATRPAAPGPRTTELLEWLPDPVITGVWPRTFDAPRAPAPLHQVRPDAALPPEGVTAAAAREAAAATVVSAPAFGASGFGGFGAAAWGGVGFDDAAIGRVAFDIAADPTAADPTVGSTGVDPTDPTAVGPTADDPTTVDPTAVDPSAVGPTAVDSTAGPAAAGPIAAGPAADDPTAAVGPAAAGRAVGPAAAGPAADAPDAGVASASDPAGSDGVGPAAPGGAEIPAGEVLVGTLTLPSGVVPLLAARLDEAGVPVPPAPGTAALLDEGGAQLVLLAAADAIPLDEAITVAVDGADPRERTVVETQTLTPEELAEHVRTLPDGEFQVVAPAADGTWTLAELE